MIAEIVLGRPQWLVPVIVAGVLFAIVISVLNVMGRNRFRGSRTALVFSSFLKLLAIGLMLFSLLDPLRSTMKPKPKANVMAVLVDDSESMNMRISSDDSVTEGKTRGQWMSQSIWRNDPWIQELRDEFDLRFYGFGGQLRSVTDHTELDAKQRSTALAAAIQSLSERLGNKPTAGVILWSDGNTTDAAKNRSLYKDLPFPIYPIVSEAESPTRDLRVSRVTVSQTDFETSPLTISAEVTGEQIAGSTTVSLREIGSDVPIETRTITLKPDTPATMEFRFRPETPGVSFYEVVTETADADREVTQQNNRRVAVANRDQGPYRILYVSGRPNWEYKFFRRAVEEDPELELVGLIRIANKQPKFSFRGGSGSDTNPLFAGLGAEEEETASQLDEPVMIRLGVKDSAELNQGFPRTDAELFDFHAVVLDNIEEGFLTQDQWLRLRDFVGDRGGGLLVMADQTTLERKLLRDTPLGELVPVYPNETSLTRSRNQDVHRWDLSREGWLAPWLRLREDESSEQTRMASMPAFRSRFALGRAKPGATTLIIADDDAGESVPILTTQRFGAGRSCVLATGDLWRWSMQTKQDDQQPELVNDQSIDNNHDAARSWRQIVRWLANETGEQVELEVEPASDDSRPATIRVFARDDEFQPLENAEVKLSVTKPDGATMELIAERDLENPGSYYAEFWGNENGPYQVNATVSAFSPDGDEQYIGDQEIGWAIEFAAAEWQHTQPNTKLLHRIADESGGEVVPISELDSFVRTLDQQKVPIQERQLTPLWHQSWIMLIAIASLCGDWWIRRRRGLP